MAKGSKHKSGAPGRQRGGAGGGGSPGRPGGGGGGGGTRPGRGGGIPNMGQMLQQVQRMQQDMAEAQEQLKHEVVSASAGGGMVKVEVSGELAIKSVTIDPAAIDPEDAEMLADMVLAAVNEALRAAQELAASRLGGATGGLDLGGLGELGGLGGLGLPGLQQ